MAKKISAKVEAGAFFDEKQKAIVITIPYDPSAKYPDSSTGRSEQVGSSHGWMNIRGTEGVAVNFNVNRRK